LSTTATISYSKWDSWEVAVLKVGTFLDASIGAQHPEVLVGTTGQPIRGEITGHILFVHIGAQEGHIGALGKAT